MSDPVARGLRIRLAEMRAEHSTRRRRRQRAGLTMLEIVVVVGIIGVFAAMAFPSVQQFLANQRVKSAARSIADAFRLARTEAIRTGDAHIVFLSASSGGNPPATDPAGTSLGADPRGGTWPAIILDDGAPGAWNCRIDAADPRRQIASEPGVAWGWTLTGGVQAPGDGAAGDPATGSSFADPAGNDVTWVMFRGDGLPVTFDAACNLGTLGSGNGAVYVTNGQRDYAVVLTALGAVRVHAWDAGAGQWTD
jgi:prepilin-type N-terminal cleavage/methylation domain-containing protein